MRRTFDRGILAGIALLIALIGLSAVTNYRNTLQLHADAGKVAQSHEVLDLTAGVMLGLVDTETGERGYLLTGREDFLTPYTNALPRLEQLMAKLKEKTQDNPPQHERVLNLAEMSSSRLELLKQLIDARRNRLRDVDPFQAGLRGKNSMDRIRELVAEIDHEERALLLEREQRSQRTFQVALATGTSTACLGIVAIGGFVWLLSRNLEARQAAAAELFEHGELFRTTLASIGDAVIATDIEGKATFLNPVAEHLTGWTDAEARGQPLETIFRITQEDSRLPVENQASRALREGKAISCNHPSILISREGAETPIDDSAAPIRNEQGVVSGVVLVFRDVTEQRRSEKKMRESDRLKDEYLAVLAHELRNPLAPIRNSLYIMKQAAATPSVIAGARDMAERQVQHMARLLDDLLDVSRISRGKIELRKEVVDVALLAHRTMEAVRPLIEEPRHQITVSLPNEPLLVLGDPTRIEQILTNLLNNAAKYTEPGGRIWLTVQKEGEEAVMRVRDNGMGIAPEILPLIFDLFVQDKRGEARSRGGMGIGLTLVRKLVELHLGSVQATSAGPVQGSEFVVRIPAVASLPDADQRKESGALIEGNTPSRRILVVDDNVDAAESLALLLRMQGQDVRVAFDGPGALLSAREFQPQTVFLDIGMPGMDGYMVAERLQADLATCRPVLVALTGWGQEEDRRRSREAGFDYHLVKPVEPDALGRVLTG